MEGKSSEFFSIKHMVAQACTLSPTLFLIDINGLSCEIEKCSELNVKLSENTLFGHLFVYNFVGVAETKSALHRLIDIVHNYSKRWYFEANVKKYAVVIFSKLGKVSGGWVWSGESPLVLDSYCYLGIEFSSDGS